MTGLRFSGWLGATLAIAVVASCGGSKNSEVGCPAGSEACACYPNSTCNAGLDCRSNVCVNLNPDAGASGAGPQGVDREACLGCARASCSAQVTACEASAACADLLRCYAGCGSKAECVQGCASDAGADSIIKAQVAWGCSMQSCTSACTMRLGGTGDAGDAGEPMASSGRSGSSPWVSGSASASGAAISGASGSGAAGASGVATSGWSGVATSGGPSGSTSGGLAGRSGGVSGGTSGFVTTGRSGGVSGGTSGVSNPAVTWLSIEEDFASSTDPVNGALGINGVFYAYGDDCTMLGGLYWEPETRCLRGRACARSPENWGAAIGFDFANFGTELEPLKRRWDSTRYDVRGVAWRVSGSNYAPLGVWVQNILPEYAITGCPLDECAIALPPDGVAGASWSGQLMFDTMTKEYWGGETRSYIFDPTNVVAVQFKVTAGPVDRVFEICIDRFGVVR